MSIFGMGGGSQKPTRINRVQINQAVQGFPLAVVMGRARIQQALLWVDGLKSKAVSQGGKGLGGGKGGSAYLYSADVIAGLCNGPISGIGDVWSGQSWLSNNNTTETYVISGGTPVYTPTNASSGVFLDGGVGVQTAYSSSQTDLGAGSPVTLSGTDTPSMAAVPYGTTLTTGHYSIDPATNAYHFAAADAGKTVVIAYSFALNIIKQQENDIIPAGRTIAVGGTFVFHENDGVVYFTGPNNGVKLTEVFVSPTVTGTYQRTGSAPATYHFATGDIGAEVQITFKIQNNSVVPKGAPGTLSFSTFAGKLGQAVWSMLTTSFPQQALAYTGIAYAAYNPMTLGYAAELQQNTFEVQTPDAYGGGITDCNPVQCILQVLTNKVWGLGAGAQPFPTSAIDNGGSGTWGGAAGTPGARTAGGTAWNWFAANGFFISPVIDHQDSAATLITQWLEAGQCSLFMSEGLVKLVPYGDTSTAGNGATWTAPTAFAAALDDTCFVERSKGEDPVKISSTPWQDAYNTVQVQWSNRSNQYAPEVTPESDQAAINRYGSRIEDPQNWDFIHTLTSAIFAASMRVKRNVYTRNTYEFCLPYSYSYLECMDVVNITTSSSWAVGLNNANLGLTNLPVRITKIVDLPNGELEITAEDYPFGVHQPTLYNKAIGSGQVQQNIFADPGDSEVVLFEATSRLTGFAGNQIWIGATGVAEDWGSCNVFVSDTGTTYKQVGTIDKVARLGELHSTFASGSDPDTVNSLVVDMVENSGQLEAGTTTDADSGNTLCFVDGEIIAYSACAISGQDQYTMGTYIRRGQMGSTISSHATSSLFMRLDDSVFKFTYDPTWAGKTLYFKFQSVNTFGNSAQDLSTLTPVTFTVPGLNPGTVDASSGLVIGAGQFNVGAGNQGYATAATTTDGPINKSAGVYSGWAGSALPGGVTSPYWYVRWVGYLVPSVTGQYTLGTNSHGGSNLYLAGKPIVADLADAAGANTPTAYSKSSKVMLTAGVYYPIVLEWQGADAVNFACQLLWTPPGGSIAVVPAANLSTSGASVTNNLAGSWWNGTPSLWYPTGQSYVDPSGAGLIAKGNVPPSLGSGFTYSATTTTITWSWPAETAVYRSDGTFVSIGAGSQAITGLTSGQTYEFYPVYDETTGVLKFLGASDVPFPTLTGVTLNGTTGYVSADTSRNDFRISDITFEIWFKGTGTSNQPLFDLSAPDVIGTTGNKSFELLISGGTSILAKSLIGASVITTVITTGTLEPALNDGTLHHLVVVYFGGSSRVYAVYLDGVQVTNSTGAQGVITAISTMFWHIGAMSGKAGWTNTGSGAFSSWTLSNAAIYAGTLSLAQIQTHYTAMVNQGVTQYNAVVTADAPLNWWKLNETSGTVAADSGSGGDTGTYRGGFTQNVSSKAMDPVGSPAIAYNAKTYVMAQGLIGRGRVALSGGAMEAVATAGSGGGGGSGSGGGCFSGNTRIKTTNGYRRLEDLPTEETFWIENHNGIHAARLIIHREWHEEMIDMGNGELVTFGHHVKRWESEEYRPAIHVLPHHPTVDYTGTVYNLEVFDDSHHYVLENGLIAHNLKPL